MRLSDVKAGDEYYGIEFRMSPEHEAQVGPHKDPWYPDSFYATKDEALAELERAKDCGLRLRVSKFRKKENPGPAVWHVWRDFSERIDE